MKKRKMITIMMTLILSVSSCFSAYCAEVSSAEAGPAAAVEEPQGAEGDAEETVPEESIPAEETLPEESIPAEETVPDENIPAEETVPEESIPAEETVPEVNIPAEETVPDENIPAEKTVPDENILPEEEIILEDETDEQAYTPKDKTSADELFAGYVDAEFGIASEGVGKPGLLRRRASAGSKLKGDTLSVYFYISSQLPLIASGEITSTHFAVPDEDVSFLTETAWTAEELGVPAIAEGNVIRQDAKDAAAAKLREEYFDLSVLIDALLADHPYLLYWYDKTPKTTADGYRFRAYRENGVWYLGYRGSLVLNFPVAEEYAAGDYTVDASIGQTVQTSVENALAVVAKFEDLPDYEKLAAYRQEICDLTSYNYGAISGNVPYGNPWQLIWVFDGDPATEVVCEGYAKAFKYLCDRSSFENEIDCRTVTGKINGAGHMWNLVTMEDGWNYLTDVTNCDTNTAGADDKLFLVGAYGSPLEGYTANSDCLSRMHYTYDQDMLDLWSIEELTVPMYGYPPTIENAVVDGIEDREFTGEEITQEITVYYSGRALSEGTDYTVSYENNTDLGTARIIIEGAGNYRGTIERGFEIVKASQPLSVSAGKIVNGRSAVVTISGAQGALTAKIADPAIAEITNDDGAGKITVRGLSTGVATLIVTAAETEYCRETVLETEIRVVPAASTHVEVTNVASGLKISWNEVAGARHYKVYRGNKFLFSTTRAYATDKEVKLDNGIKYTYRVIASTTEDSSGDSTISRTGTGYRLLPVGITSLKNTEAGKLAVTYGEKNPKATGYVIRFGLKADMSDAKVITVQGAGTLQRVLSGVRKGKTYYVQVRTYKLVNGVRFYSGYCTTKSLRITK